MPFLRRARAGIGGVSTSGRLLALTVDGERVLYRLTMTPPFAPVAREPALVVGGFDPPEVDLPPAWRELLALVL